MFLKANGKLIKSSTGIMSIAPPGDIILSFEVQGSYFPARYATANTTSIQFFSQDSTANSLYIDYGDGTGEHEYPFIGLGTLRRCYFVVNPNTLDPALITQTGSFNHPVYFYQDLPNGVKNTVDDFYPTRRIIKMRFSKPGAVTQLSTNRWRLYNNFPSTIAKLQNLRTLGLQTVVNLTFFPIDFYNSRIRILTLSTVGSVMDNGFPNWILNSPIEQLNLGASINLSGDPVTKKFSEIYKLKDTLTSLDIGTSLINYRLPQEITQLYKLASLDISVCNNSALRFPLDLSGWIALQTLIIERCTGMPFSEVERIIQNIPSLKTLDYRNSGNTVDRDISSTNTNIETLHIGGATWNNKAVPSFVNKLTGLKILTLYQVSGNLNQNLENWGNFQNCVNLETIDASRLTTMSSIIPTWFVNFTKLKTFTMRACFGTQARTDEFVNNVYDFINLNSLKTGTSSVPFRSMNINIYGTNTDELAFSLRPSGTYQMPAGYVAGSNNGTPASPMEKIWVMVNQYAHTWTVKP